MRLTLADHALELSKDAWRHGDVAAGASDFADYDRLPPSVPAATSGTREHWLNLACGTPNPSTPVQAMVQAESAAARTRHCDLGRAVQRLVQPPLFYAGQNDFANTEGACARPSGPVNWFKPLDPGAGLARTGRTNGRSRTAGCHCADRNGGKIGGCSNPQRDTVTFHTGSYATLVKSRPIHCSVGIPHYNQTMRALSLRASNRHFRIFTRRRWRVRTTTPVVAAGGILNAASNPRRAFRCPGSLVSVYGTALASSLANADTIPLFPPSSATSP